MVTAPRKSPKLVNPSASTSNPLPTSSSLATLEPAAMGDSASTDEALCALIREELRAALGSANLRGPIGECRERGAAGKQGPPGNASSSQQKFSAQDLGFFYLDALELYGIDHVNHNHKETNFQEVYTFNKRVHNYVLLIDKTTVRDNLSLCFWGSALSWYLEEIDKFKKKKHFEACHLSTSRISWLYNSRWV